MTRRKKVLLYTWLLSWAFVGSTLIAVAWMSGLSLESLDTAPGRFATYVEAVEVEWTAVSVALLMFVALAAGPCVYVSWRLVEGLIPRDEEEE